MQHDGENGQRKQRREHYPRPQLVRDHWLDLQGTWQFCYDDRNVGRTHGWVTTPDVFDREIVVPFPPESPASGIGDTGFHPVVWYRRTFRIGDGQVPPAWAEQRLLLHFGAVDYEAQVWVNGQFVAQHEGGHTPFSADITTALRSDAAEHVIVVRAEDRPTDLTQPRGKQYWEREPRRIWYHRTTGIWQPVWLEPVAPVHITDVRWTPNVERGLLGMEVSLNTAPNEPLQLHIELSLHGVTLADEIVQVKGSQLRREIALVPADTPLSREQLLWSPAHPNLIDAMLTLRRGEQIIDQVRSYAGLRSVGFSNGRFLLNDRPYYLRMVLAQNYWSEGHLAPPHADALRREVELTKAMGFNGVRIHQKVEDPRFLYWCDQLGLVVWGEMANAYVFGPTAVERLAREWMEVLRRDYSHPCIVTWVPLNESWGVPHLERDPKQQAYVRALYQLTHALDGTRPVIGNDGWEHLASDVWGLHDYVLDGATIRERYSTPEAVERTLYELQPHYRTMVLPDTHRQGEPIMLTECGGISYAPEGDEAWFAYGTVDHPDEFLAKYEEVVVAILDCPTIVGFCYTQLTDTEQETNGLLTTDRTPKLDMEAVRATTTRPSKAMPSEVFINMQMTGEVTAFQSGGH